MIKAFVSFFCFIFIVMIVISSRCWSQKADPTILDFKVQPLYRAAKLTWKAKGDLKSGIPVQILRADNFEEGPYREVETVHLTSDKSTYEYVDKTMGAEAKYYYKLIIKDTNESFGPIATRPYFSPPATHYQRLGPKRQNDYILVFHF